MIEHKIQNTFFWVNEAWNVGQSDLILVDAARLSKTQPHNQFQDGRLQSTQELNSDLKMNLSKWSMKQR